MQGTEVGNNTFISHSVIGRNCKIGANVKIVGSYIWNGATVADGATISYSIVCNEARIMAGAVVDKASLVSFRVRLLSRVCRACRVSLMMRYCPA
jgi:translation initiation factor eIF-2B subunit epsilon